MASIDYTQFLSEREIIRHDLLQFGTLEGNFGMSSFVYKFRFVLTSDPLMLFLVDDCQNVDSVRLVHVEPKSLEDNFIIFHLESPPLYLCDIDSSSCTIQFSRSKNWNREPAYDVKFQTVPIGVRLSTTSTTDQPPSTPNLILLSSTAERSLIINSALSPTRFRFVLDRIRLDSKLDCLDLSGMRLHYESESIYCFDVLRKCLQRCGVVSIQTIVFPNIHIDTQSVRFISTFLRDVIGSATRYNKR